MIVSSDGHCRAFDARADGTIFGSGVGLVLLKRLSDALADGDPIFAVVKGTAANNDGGTKVGYMAPSGDGQAAVVTEAMALAGIGPDTIGFVEAHGTGTKIGDPIEVNGLTQAFRAKTDHAGYCAIGSVKTNVGHLQIASGIAGFIKAVLAVQHGMIPANLHFESPNPAIDFERSPFYVNTQLTPWPASGAPRRAGVNSLGIGGTNVHAILEEAPPVATATDGVERPQHVLMLSARSEPALMALAGRYAARCNDVPEHALADFCFTANTGRKPFEHRLAVVSDSVIQLQQELAAVARGQRSSRVSWGSSLASGRPRLAFLFTGQGSQYAGMGRQLYETQPVFRRCLDRCAEILQSVLDVPLLDVMYPANDASPRLDETVYTQPALFALEYALAELWKSWGIEPTVVMGHSLGEYVAACVAGIFSLEDGLTLVAERARLMQALPQDGEMVVVFAPEAQVRPHLSALSHEVAVAAENGPAHTVISGRIQAVEVIVGRLQAEGVSTQTVKTSHAFHSPLMEPMLADFACAAGQITYASPQIDIISNLTGTWASDEMATPEYWCRHIRQPVKFMAGMTTLHEQGYETFIEIGPKPILLGMGASCLGSDVGVWLPSLRQGQSDWQPILQSLATLSIQIPVDWPGFDREYPRRRMTLPTYPFERQRYWIERPVDAAIDGYSAALNRADTASLLGRKLQLPTLKSTVYENHFSSQALPFLQDHQVFDTTVVSGACYVAMLLAATTRTFGKGAYEVKDLYFPQPLIIHDGQARTVQLALTPEGAASASFQLISFATQSTEDQPVWTTHAEGMVRWESAAEMMAADRACAETLSTLWGRCAEDVTAEAFLQAQLDRQIALGPSYRWLESIRRGTLETVGRLRVPESLGGLDGESLHPGLLDACFGLLLASGAIPAGETWLPFYIEAVRLYQEPDRDGMWAHLVLREDSASGDSRRVADVQLCNSAGQVVMEFAGLEARPASREVVLRHIQGAPSGWMYEIAWRTTTAVAQSLDRPTDVADQWLIFADQQGMAQSLAQQLRAGGARCVLVRADRDYGVVDRDYYHIDPTQAGQFQRLLHESVGEGSPQYRGIIHLWSLDEPGVTQAGWLSHTQTLACESILHLVQALVQTGRSEGAQLWLVTHGAQSVNLGAHEPQIQQVPLWGLGLVVTLEHPELHCTRVDLDPDVPASDPTALLALLRTPFDEPQIVLRRDGRHVPRLVPRTVPATDGNCLIRADASYMITGGTGGLGLRLAAWMVAQGARYLVLVSRRPASPDAMAEIEQMQRAGAYVEVVQADVSDRDAMADVFDKIRTDLPVLSGVIHGAGMLDDGLLVEQNWQRFKSVFAAKIQGAWHLHEFTQDIALDFFVLFSSAASVLGNQGQGNYAAANAFLDGLAAYRRQRGLVATSVNWGPWDQVGIAVSDPAIRDHMARQGFTGIKPEDGLQVFEQLLAGNLTQLGIIDCDWHTYIAQLAKPSSFVSELVHARPSVVGGETSAVSTPDILHALRQTPPERRKQTLAALIQDIVQQLLGTHGADALDPNQPLIEQGLDSLMAVQLRNAIGHSLGQALPVSLAFNYPTVRDIVDFVETQLPDVHTAIGPSMPQAQAPPITLSAQDILAEIDKLLEEEP